MTVNYARNSAVSLHEYKSFSVWGQGFPMRNQSGMRWNKVIALHLFLSYAFNLFVTLVQKKCLPGGHLSGVQFFTIIRSHVSHSRIPRCVMFYKYCLAVINIKLWTLTVLSSDTSVDVTISFSRTDWWNISTGNQFQ